MRWFPYTHGGGSTDIRRFSLMESKYVHYSCTTPVLQLTDLVCANNDIIQIRAAVLPEAGGDPTYTKFYKIMAAAEGDAARVLPGLPVLSPIAIASGTSPEIAFRILYKGGHAQCLATSHDGRTIPLRDLRIGSLVRIDIGRLILAAVGIPGRRVLCAELTLQASHVHTVPMAPAE